VAGGWRRLHNEELHKVYASPNIIRVIKSRGMRLEGHVVLMDKMINIYITCWSQNLKGRFHWKDLGVYGRIILEWTLGKWSVKMWTGCMYTSAERLVAGSCEHGDEPFGFHIIKRGSFLTS
jgi:hypothetical protein